MICEGSEKITMGPFKLRQGLLVAKCSYCKLEIIVRFKSGTLANLLGQNSDKIKYLEFHAK